MTTIRNILGLKEPKEHKYVKIPEYEAADPQLLMGVELEIERVDDADDMISGIGPITHVEDGSLRNAGREFITSPMNFRNLYYVLESFFKQAKFTKDNYSDRTSIHVHCNVQDLTLEQLSIVLMLYQVFEGLFYDFVGEDRDKNIFCVPWAETNLSFNILKGLNSGSTAKVLNLKNWQKYTGLNLLPIFSQGTIEFRQMPGTCDLPRISNWLNLIGSLFAFARANELTSVTDRFIKLNTNSAYRPLTQEVFKQWSPLLLDNPNYWRFMEDGVLNMKYMLLDNKSNNKGLKMAGADRVILDDFLREDRNADWARFATAFARTAELGRPIALDGQVEQAAQANNVLPQPELRIRPAARQVRRVDQAIVRVDNALGGEE